MRENDSHWVVMPNLHAESSLRSASGNIKRGVRYGKSLENVVGPLTRLFGAVG